MKTRRHAAELYAFFVTVHKDNSMKTRRHAAELYAFFVNPSLPLPLLFLSREKEEREKNLGKYKLVTEKGENIVVQSVPLQIQRDTCSFLLARKQSGAPHNQML